MFESEASSVKEKLSQLPEDVLQEFGKLKSKIISRSIINWAEHCTECNWPSCYTSCELYSPRNDEKCRLFIDGAIRLENREGVNPYLLKIKFKRWGKLWSMGNVKLYPFKKAKIIEKIDEYLGGSVRKVPLSSGLKVNLIHKYSNLKKKLSTSPDKSEDKPTHFIIECHNPNSFTIQLTLTIKNRTDNDTADPGCEIPPPINFQELITLNNGYNLTKILFEDIQSKINFALPFDIELTPNNIEDGTTLIFGLTEFATLPESKKQKKNKCKCVIWDLDNTMWDGILVEDGPEKIKLKTGIREIIQELDQRGILNSVASKNNEKDTLEVLEKLGLIDYFLYPKITWDPKSISVANICTQLNIGRDTIFFVDDQKFEREEVKSTLPEITCVDAKDYQKLLDMPEFQVLVTEESKRRRSMYRDAMKRDEVLSSHQGDYIEFLKSCDLQTVLSPLSNSNSKRVYELAQRTNQMNFSGNRYDKSELDDFMKSEKHDTYVIECADKFGSYGIVGFGIVETDEPRLIDLLFSCRVQSKRVEHAIITYMINKYNAGNTKDFFVNYKKTEKNKPSGRVFYDLGFIDAETEDGISTLVFKRDKVLEDEGIVKIQIKQEN